MKVCSQCKKEKPLSEFWKDSSKAQGVEGYCIECKRVRKREYKIKYNRKTTEYNKRWNKKNPSRAVYHSISVSARKRNLSYAPVDDFVTWYDNQVKVCHYCGCSLDTQILDRANRFEIDRKDSTKGYTIDNIVLACSRCNIAKFDYWSYKEFKKYLGPAIKLARDNS